MSGNFEQIEQPQIIAQSLPKPQRPPKPTFSENMTEFVKEFKPTISIESKDLPNYKNITAFVGVNIPYTQKDSPKIALGLEARTSIFNTPQGLKTAKSILPNLRISKNIAKNTELMASIKPNSHEYVKIGATFKF